MWHKWWALVMVGSLVLALVVSPASTDVVWAATGKKQGKTAKRTGESSLVQKKISKARPAQGKRVSAKSRAQTKNQIAQNRVSPKRAKTSVARASKPSVARFTQKTGKRKVRRSPLVRRPAPQSQFVPTPSYSFFAETPPLPPPHTFAAALLAEAETGQILFALNDHREWPTASLAKMMVALLTLEAVERKDVSFSTVVPISQRASRAGGRTIRLRPGEEFLLEELLQAMMVTSANDAAVALAERLQGSVEACVEAMNRRAFQLGMGETLFQTPNGMPLADGTPPDVSSAADLLILARALAKHPWLLYWTSLDHIPFRDGRVSLPNTNRLVGRVQGVDGLKTGFTAKARFNLVTTAQRGPHRLIAVVLGGQSSGLRFRTAENLLEWGFARLPRSTALGDNLPSSLDSASLYGENLPFAASFPRP